METKRWRVRGPKYVYRREDGSYLGPGAVFEATDAEVRGQEHKLEVVDEWTAPELPPRAAPSEPEADARKPRRARVHRDRMMVQAPESTVMQ
jgi:hypothetical protein